MFDIPAQRVVGGLLFWQYLVRPAEERDLREAFGNQFAAYCSDVQCWIPRVSPYRGAGL